MNIIINYSIHIKVLGTIRIEEINKSEHACMKISHRSRVAIRSPNVDDQSLLAFLLLLLAATQAAPRSDVG